MRFLWPVALALLAAACVPKSTPPPTPSPEPEKLVLSRVSFESLPGWTEDRQAEALPALLKSCARIGQRADGEAVGPDGMAGTAKDWRGLCEEAARLRPSDAVAARRFFEGSFVPFAATDNGTPTGLFTGYYEPELKGSRTRSARYAAPLLRRPPDLVSVELGDFRADWRGQRIAGRVVAGRLKPFETRAQIEAGALAGGNLELLWAEDPIAVFFLQIQGSGRVLLPDGRLVRVGFDGQNGRPYVPVGRVLAERGDLPRDGVSMQSIAGWMRSHPERAQALMNENPSYVFFREVSGDGPIGSQGVALTPGRSLAVDATFLALGLPVWLDAVDDGNGGAVLRRLAIAQDTGGAIRGPVRGDVFWGAGAEAEERAGRMRARGRYYILLPVAVAARR